MDHLDSQSILNENQHGFRAKRSCESQLLMTTNEIAKWMNNNVQVDIAILDFAKAFDKVAHKRLSLKLKYYGIDGTTRTWIDSFLRKRVQRVVVDGEVSKSSHVTSGVPQGTGIGPTLFLVFINDIADNLNSTTRLFADDCVLHRPIRTEQDHQLLQEDLDTLVHWSNTWQMEFNISKCAIMQATNKRHKTNFPYKMKGQTLEIVDHQPYLGVELSSNLKYNLHIDQSCKKASRALGFLKRNLKHCPPSVKERAYTSLVRPKLEYCSTIWNPHTSRNINKLESVQKNAARFVLNKPLDYKKPESSSQMVKQLNWETLQQRRNTSDVILMYKIVHHLIAVPVYHHPIMAGVTSTRQSHSAKFQTIGANINAYKFSFFPRTIILWNSLPPPVIAIPDLDTFKVAIKEQY